MWSGIRQTDESPSVAFKRSNVHHYTTLHRVRLYSRESLALCAYCSFNVKRRKGLWPTIVQNRHFRRRRRGAGIAGFPGMKTRAAPHVAEPSGS